MIRCEYCGRRHADAIRYCGTCGALLSESTLPPVRPRRPLPELKLTPKPRRRGGFLAFIFLLLGIATAIGAFARVTDRTGSTRTFVPFNCPDRPFKGLQPGREPNRSFLDRELERRFPRDRRNDSDAIEWRAPRRRDLDSRRG
jgi:hypothetical protein